MAWRLEWPEFFFTKSVFAWYAVLKSSCRLKLLLNRIGASDLGCFSRTIVSVKATTKIHFLAGPAMTRNPHWAAGHHLECLCRPKPDSAARVCPMRATSSLTRTQRASRTPTWRVLPYVRVHSSASAGGVRHGQPPSQRIWARVCFRQTVSAQAPPHRAAEWLAETSDLESWLPGSHAGAELRQGRLLASSWASE